MSRPRRFSLTIRAKIIVSNVVLLALLGGSLWYLRDNIVRGGDAVDAQRAVLERLAAANGVAKTFGDFRYWLTDFALSQLNEAEEQARLRHQELGRHLQALEAADPKRVAAIRQHVDAIAKAMQEAVRAYLDDNRVLGNSMVAQSRRSADEAVRLIQAFVAEQQDQAKRAGDTVVARAADSARLAIVLLVVSIAVGFTLAVLTIRSIVRSIAAMSSAIKALAGGDLTARVEASGNDEMAAMGRELNDAIGQMAAIVRDVRATAVHVGSGSSQLSAAAEQLSSGAQEQASSLEETAASLEEITGTVKQNADNAKQANQLAMGSRDTAEKGGQVVTSAVEAMAAINQASKKIADIITTIDEIAFQTNLLALNAAVEAARAGEQGRGFAVVASEVRNLAQRSATAAKEITALIQDSVTKVESGSELVNKSGDTLQEIVNSVKRVTDIIAEIAAASQEQSAGIDQVNRAVTQMDQVTQSNAAQTEELSSTAQSLSTQAAELQSLVGRFRLDDGTAAAAIGAPSAPAKKVVAKPSASVAARARATKKAEPALVEAHAGNGSAHGPDDGFEEF